ncbi:hypothetical protein GOBAR_AA09051 [Gossypium barbadense]|uniref:Uncharacterized protein n=1 Tax=Gossypium barbadense TaxID=3634 RepID=A0A2P5Y7N6_GOSBA|nr:hypothetical protein GOBAR_AA09051 [Gossypium barbadense]
MSSGAFSSVDWERGYWGGFISPSVLRQKNVISSGSYGHGRSGHGSRGEPFPSSQASNVGVNGDDPLPMPLRLVMNHKGDEICKVDDVPIASQQREGERWMWWLRAYKSFSSLNSSVYKPSAVPNSVTLSWRTNPPRQIGPYWDHRSSSLRSEDGTLSIVPS